MIMARSVRRDVRLNRRARSGQRNVRQPFLPPEDWHEPLDTVGDYRILVQPPGAGFRHILTPAEIRGRLAELPPHFLAPLEVIQLSRMTRKKRCFPCYGMQWGSALYLYPLEESLIEHYRRPPSPDVYNECRMYGGRWRQLPDNTWQLVWTEEAIKDYYLNNILMHELGHLLDDRNSGHDDRERFAEWFAVEYGYRRTRSSAPCKPVIRRHHRS
jgi:hypothetical protein